MTVDGPTAVPRRLRHALDPARFTPERLAALAARAPAGLVELQEADRDRVRSATPPRRPWTPETLAAVIAAEPVQLQISGLEHWAPELDDARDHALALLGLDGVRLYDVRTAIRVFGGGTTLPLHAHGEAPMECVVAGRAVWHLHPPERLDEPGHEALHHGGQFGVPEPDLPATHRLELGPGDAAFAPARWLHWVEHVSTEQVVSYEVEFWTRRSARERKVRDVNWALRRARLRPRPPGRSPLRDAAKVAAFDLGSRLTGRGSALRGA